MKKLFAAAGLRVETDETGNVIGEFPGSSPDIVMLTAHLDTVFPAGTDVHVKREGGRLLAPGISDNGTGLAALVALARCFPRSENQDQQDRFSSLRTSAKRAKEIFAACARWPTPTRSV